MINGIKSIAQARKQEELDAIVYGSVMESDKVSDMFAELHSVATSNDIYLSESKCKVVKEDSEEEELDKLIDQIPESEDLSGEDLAELIKDGEDSVSFDELDDLI